MNKIKYTIHSIQEMELESQANHWLSSLHPLAKLLVTISYIFFIASYHKYQLTPLIIMAIYPIVFFISFDYSFRELWIRMKVFFLMAILLGMINPFFDHTLIFYLAGFPITGGILSMLTLFLKGSLCIMASYLLICSTSMNGICYALRCLHMPKSFVMILMLLYRYIFLFLEEVERTMDAYTLRAPGHKGVHYKAWGSMIGQMLLRTLDRAESLYLSMKLRGFHGDLLFYPKQKVRFHDFIYCLGMILLFIVLRIYFL